MSTRSSAKPHESTKSIPTILQPRSRNDNLEPRRESCFNSNDTHIILAGASAYQIRRATEAIKGFDISMLVELERIKRPSQAVFDIAQMLCMFVEIFKSSEKYTVDISQVQSWLDLQEHVS